NPFGRMPSNAVALDWRAVAFTLGAAAFSTILCGLAPALQASRPDLNEAMKSSGRGVSGTRDAARARSLMAAGQIALSLVIVTAAVLMIETLARLESTPLGFRMDGVTVVEAGIPRKGPDSRTVFDGMLAKIKTVPGVEIAAMTNTWPLSIGFQDRLQVEGRPAPKKADASALSTRQWITSEYFAAMGIPLLEGRGFTEHDGEHSTPAAIVSRMAADRWFGGHAVGQRLKFEHEKEWRTVVGVAGDTATTFYNTIEWLHEPRVYEPAEQGGMEFTSPVHRTFYVVARGREIGKPEAEKILKSVSPDLRTARVQSVRQMVADVVQQPKLRMQMLGGFAAMALLLAAIGVYGVVAQSVIQRRREIGIRVALGAQRNDVVRMVAAQGLRIAMAGIAAGVAGAIAAARLLAGLLYGVEPTDAGALTLAAAVLALAAVAAAALPARSAASVDPLRTLREE
ncbi:MAG TPA: FtsX-like permease family protein, partial [Bryobacteraceae bacterium]